MLRKLKLVTELKRSKTKWQVFEDVTTFYLEPGVDRVVDRGVRWFLPRLSTKVEKLR